MYKIYNFILLIFNNSYKNKYIYIQLSAHQNIIRHERMSSNTANLTVLTSQPTQLRCRNSNELN